MIRVLSRAMVVLLAAFCLLALASRMALAQVLPDPGGDLLGRSDLIGVIPGTDMQRDEFRARAEVQLDAIALNALVHRTVWGEYPASLPELKASDAWNLMPLNMFTGEPVRMIFFEPAEGDFTLEPYLDLPFEFQIPVVPPAAAGNGEDAADVFGAQLALSMGQSRQARVDPAKVSPVTGGDIYYYTDGELLQLILFAPDGTYVEHVDPTPHMGWRARMNVSAKTSDWPADLYCAQLLLFCDVLLPNLYNYVMYMADKEVIPRSKLEYLLGDECIEMSEALGITLRNPFSREPLVAEDDPQAGNFLAGTALAVATQGGDLLTQAQLDAAPPISLDEVPPPPGSEVDNRPRDNSGSRPPLGGHR